MEKLLTLSTMLCICAVYLTVAKGKPAAPLAGGKEGANQAELSSLINSASVVKSIKPREFGSFAVGTISDKKTWQTFATKAGLPKNVSVDWERQVVLYVILKVNSNSISFSKWIEPKKGTGELVFNWSLIEPGHGDRYPALVHVVKRADLKSVQFSYWRDVGEVEKLGTINLKPSPVKEASTRSAPLFSPDDVSADKMELRGGLWYVKGETKPFTGRVISYTSGLKPINKRGIKVVTTYLNGKEQDMVFDAPWGTVRRQAAEVLFDGKNLDHFEFAKGAWEIEKDGSVVCCMQEQKDRKGKVRLRGMGYLWTQKEFSDFELSLSYKLSPGANSGVFYRTDKNNPVQGGFELQLMDNEGFQKKANRKLPPRKLNGSFYDGAAPTKDFSKPVGQWNELVLRCKGPIITCHINGGQCFSVNVDNWDTPGQNPDGSANKFKSALKDLPRKGRIGFQNHGQVVWFKDIKVRPLR